MDIPLNTAVGCRASCSERHQIARSLVCSRDVGGQVEQPDAEPWFGANADKDKMEVWSKGDGQGKVKSDQIKTWANEIKLYIQGYFLFRAKSKERWRYQTTHQLP